MQVATSPSIAMSSNFTVHLAFHGSNGNLWVGNNGPRSGQDTGGWVLVYTSPSIAVGGPDNSAVVAFHGTNGNLWVSIESNGLHGFDTGCAMGYHDSPSAAVTAIGTRVVAFTSSTGQLGVWTLEEGCVLRSRFVGGRGSPTILAMPNSFKTQIIFKDSNAGHLAIDVNGTAEDQVFNMYGW